jgi:hypothetical protein
MKLLSSSIIVLAGALIIFGITHSSDRFGYGMGLVWLGGFAVCLIGLGGWFVAFREK